MIKSWLMVLIIDFMIQFKKFMRLLNLNQWVKSFGSAVDTVKVDENYVNTWRCDKKLNGGGIVIDQGIHLLDIMQQIAGEFDRTQSLLSCRYLKKEGIEDNAFINLYSSSTNISASMHSTITQWRYLFSFEIFLEKGSLILNGLRTNSGKYGDEVLVIKPENGGSYGGDTNDTKIEFTENTSWKKEMDEFLSSL